MKIDIKIKYIIFIFTFIIICENKFICLASNLPIYNENKNNIASQNLNEVINNNDIKRNPPTNNIDNNSTPVIPIVPNININEEGVSISPPINSPISQNKIVNEVNNNTINNNNNINRVNKITGYYNDYTGILGPLKKYYDYELSKTVVIKNHYEDNYIYLNGSYGISYYEGILTHIIKDIDNDGQYEMLLFKIKTDTVDEYSYKNIFMEVIEIVDNVATLVDSIVLHESQFLVEEMTCDITAKFIDNHYRIFLNCYEKKVRDDTWTNKFIAVDYVNNLNVIEVAETQGSYGEFIHDFEYENKIMNSGINVDFDSDIFSKPFLYRDNQMIPIYTIKRVNEKIKYGYEYDFFEQALDQIGNNGLERIRYGYTLFTDRSS